MNYIIREIKETEYHLLNDFLYEAIFIPEGVEAPPKSIINTPELQVYIAGFGTQKHDRALVAEVDNKIAGAVWVRIMNDYGHVDNNTPSFAISLYKEYRGLGIGTAMMRKMLAVLKDCGYEQVSLAVQKANYAVSMYLKVGFKIVDENDEEYIMVNNLRKNVIHIFGASGSGTSTLGKKICDELGYKFMDTDDYFWLPTNPKYTTKRDVKERLSLMKRDIQETENVVISGSLVDWGDELIPLFTLAIRLETPTDIRITRLRKREREKFGARIDKGGDMFENHQEFIEWASAYDTGSVNMRSKAKHDEWQKLLKCPLIELNGADDLDKNFEIIKKALGDCE